MGKKSYWKSLGKNILRKGEIRAPEWPSSIKSINGGGWSDPTEERRSSCMMKTWGVDGAFLQWVFFVVEFSGVKVFFPLLLGDFSRRVFFSSSLQVLSFFFPGVVGRFSASTLSCFHTYLLSLMEWEALILSLKVLLLVFVFFSHHGSQGVGAHWVLGGGSEKGFMCWVLWSSCP